MWLVQQNYPQATYNTSKNSEFNKTLLDLIFQPLISAKSMHYGNFEFPWKKDFLFGISTTRTAFIALSDPATLSHPRILPDGRVVRGSWQLFGKVMLIRNLANHHRKDPVHKTCHQFMRVFRSLKPTCNPPWKIPMVGSDDDPASRLALGLFSGDSQHPKILRLDDPKGGVF